MSNQPGPPVLEVQRVSKSFGVVQALDQVSLAVRRGTIHGIVGQNGAGKSTLMQILAGVYPPDGGTILLNGSPVAIHSPDHARRLGIRIMYQELNLIPYQTVAENISLGIEPRTRLGLLDQRTMKRRAEAILQQLGCDLPVDRHIDHLTIGQQQLIEIGKALAWKAQFLILDEPTAALEMHDIERLFAVLLRFREQGGTALYVSHRLNELFQICDCVTALRDGKVVGTVDIGKTSRADIIRMMIGRSLNEVFPDRAPDAACGSVVEARNLGAGILQHVSFGAAAGRILGVVGLEGSGIRELGKVLIGDQPLVDGQIVIDGHPVHLANPEAALRTGIVYLSADRKKEGLFPIASIAHNVAIGTLAQRRRGGLIDLAAERRLVGESIRTLRIQTPGPEQEVRYLSGGNQQKVLLARWLAARPRVFVLDEPTRGIDVGSKAEIYRLMRAVANTGVAVIIISTDLTEVLGLSDDILVLHAGQVAAHLPGGAPEDEVLGHCVGGLT